MKGIKLNQTFIDRDGKVLMKDEVNEVPLTLNDVVTSALLNTVEGDDKLPGTKKAELFSIWFDKVKDKEVLDVTTEEKASIKERIGKAYFQLIVGQAWNYLEK